MRAYVAIFIASLLLFGCIGLGTTEEKNASETVETPEVEPENAFFTVSFESIPSKVEVGSDTSILWTVSSNTNEKIRTAVVYGKNSVAFPEVPSDYEMSTEEREGTTPANFLESVTLDEPGKYYFRAYAIVDGKIYWSEERVIEAVGPSKEGLSEAREHSIEISSQGRFNESVITEAINSNVRVWFKNKYGKRVVVETPSMGEVEDLVLDPNEFGYIEFKALNTFVIILKDNNGNKLDEARFIVVGE